MTADAAAPVGPAALARKYAALVELRRRRDAGGDPSGGGALRALAAEFPGCLRELDTLGLAELERRARAATAAVVGGSPPPWMDWIDGYHALMRAALALRAPERGRAAGADSRALAAREARGRGEAPGGLFEAEVLAPPRGRMGVVVMRALAARFGVPAATIAAALFPLRRPSPYEL